MTASSNAVFRSLNVLLVANVSSFQSSMYTASRTVQALNADINRLNLGNAAASKSTQGLGASLESASKSSALLRGGLLALGATAVIGIAVASKATLEFDKNMHNVVSLLTASGASAEQAGQQYQTLSAGVLQVSRTVPQTANDLAKGLYDIVSAGIPADQAVTILGVSARAAAAGLATTEESVKAITGVMNAYGYSAKDASAISDVLFQTVNLGVINFKQLSGSIGAVTATASAAHIPIQDVGAAIATLTRAGIQPAESVTALNRVLLEFLKPSEGMTDALHKIGFESGQAAIDTLGFKGTIDKLRESTGGSASQLATMFTRAEGLKGAISLMAQNGQLYNSVTDQMITNNGYLLATQRALDEQSKSVSFQWRILANNVSAAAIGLEQQALPIIGQTIGGINDLGSSLSHVAEEVGPSLKPVGALLKDTGAAALQTAGSAGHVAGAFAAMGTAASLPILSELAHDLDNVAGFLERNRILTDALAAIVAGRYVASLGAAITETLALRAAQLTMTASTYLASAGMVAEGVAAEQTALRIAGVADVTASARAGMTGLAAFVSPLSLAVAALGASFLLYEHGQQAAKKEVNNLTVALQQESVAANGAVQSILTSQLAHASYQRVIRGLGIDEKNVIQSIQGNAQAQDGLANSLIAGSRTLQEHVQMQSLLRDALNGNKGAAHDLTEMLGHTGRDADAALAPFISRVSELSGEFDKASKTSDAFAASNTAMSQALPGSISALQNLGTAANDAAVNQKNLIELQKQLTESFTGFTDPKTALSAAIQAQSNAQKAATKSNKQAYSEQKKALADTAKSDIQNLQSRKDAVVNSAQGGRSAIQDEIDVRRDQLTADQAALKSAQDTGKGAADATAQSVGSQIVSLQAYIKEMDKENAARDAWLSNLDKVATSQDLGAGVAAQLAKLGPQGASVVQQLADDIHKGTPAAKQEMQHLTSSLLASSNSGLDQIAADSSKKWIVMAEIAKQGAQATVNSVSQALGSTPQEISLLVSQWGVSLAGGLNPILSATGNQQIVVSQGAHPGPAPAGANVSHYYADNPANVDKAISAHADGSFENHQAQIAGAGEMRLWAEPETGGEAYIPLADSKRPRSMHILAKTADMFGMELVAQAGGYARKFANGGFATGAFNLPQPPKMPSFLFGQVADRVDQYVYKKAVDFAQTTKTNQGSYGGSAAGAPKGQVVDWIHAAEQIAGWPDSYTNGLYQLIMHESGGNPNAINLTDSNAKAGHPSQGLMQTIPSTFKAYAFPGHGNITNPVDNILAGTAYALRNYGPSMVIAGGRRDAKGNYIGYADGGIYKGTYDRGGPLMPGYTMAYNGTGKPEHVLTEKMVEQIVGAIHQSRGGHQINVIADAKSVAETARVVGRKLR